jgi:D-tyrosyl-tRNA(Tyr) deacylase
MRAVIQRVSKASVTIDETLKANIGNGLLILIGVEDVDTEDDLIWLANKICNLRIFNDADGKMNLSVKDIDGEILLVSQFTLFAQTKGNNRPSYINAAKPTIAIQIYEKMIATLETILTKPIATGVFGADMKVGLVNDGPVTIWMDTKNRE